MNVASVNWNSARLKYRAADAADAPVLAAMNRQLIVDEGHSNPMSAAELEARMRHWLDEQEYEGTLIHHSSKCVGYALWHRQEHCLYVRHFFIAPEYRRQGFGREAMVWLRQHLWHDKARVRLDVLVNNTRGVQFWHALGFEDYCLTLELNGPVMERDDVRRSGK